jgi:hypothetical protein
MKWHCVNAFNGRSCNIIHKTLEEAVKHREEIGWGNNVWRVHRVKQNHRKTKMYIEADSESFCHADCKKVTKDKFRQYIRMIDKGGLSGTLRNWVYCTECNYVKVDLSGKEEIPSPSEKGNGGSRS